MRWFFSGWANSVRLVGDALLKVWQAEIERLGEDLARSSENLLKGLVLIVVAICVGFWAVGFASWTIFELLVSAMPRWLAALSVCALSVVVTLILVQGARRRLREAEAPLTAAKRRGREHVEWLQESVLPGLAGSPAPGDPAAERADTDDSDPHTSNSG